MGFFSALFSTANRPSPEEMELFAQYGDLVEALGAEEIVRGQDEDLLPTDKAQSRRARFSNRLSLIGTRYAL